MASDATTGLFGSFGQEGAPGFVDPFAAGAVGQGAGTSMSAMANRYNQLGLGGSTMQAMDMGAAPSVTGGIPAQFAAVLGELQNSALRQAPGGSGKQSPASQAGSLLSAFSK
jgi:hypothetical protein